MRDGNRTMMEQTLVNSGFSLPMRDGNKVVRAKFGCIAPGFSLPMRDGNGRISLTRPSGASRFSLPMRDGNINVSMSSDVYGKF